MNWLPSDIHPESLEERVVWHCILWTYGYYVLGALYVLAPVFGWLLAVHVARRSGLEGLPSATWAWIGGMLLMLLALMVAYADYQLGLAPMLKSMTGWAKGWALIPVFMVIGFGKVRLALLARAASLLGIQTLCVLPIVVLAWAAHLPGHLYVSPVSIVGGPGPEYFAVELYGTSPDSGAPRWRLFGPWAPAIGMVMCVYFFIAMNEENVRLRRLGMAGMLLSILASSSRLGLLAIPVTMAITWVMVNGIKPVALIVASPICLAAATLLDPILEAFESVMSGFHGARADSSRVRATLGRIAVERWRNEAVMWGHGTVERGPHLVEHMPIGSHHTWYGLLFVKGVVGVIALALPMVWSMCSLMAARNKSGLNRTGLHLLILLFLYTFAENLEILVYLYWPAPVVLGMAFCEASRPHPNHQPEMAQTPA